MPSVHINSCSSGSEKSWDPEGFSMMKKGERSVNPVYDFSSNKVRRMIKFGTNCDLSDEKKWAQHQKELQKLPAW